MDLVGDALAEAALRHLATYLSRCSDWVLVFDGFHHRDLAETIPRIVSVVERLDLRSVDESTIARIDAQYRAATNVGVLTFLVSDATADGGTIRRAQRLLRPFDKWPPARVRICFDVADANFPALFADDPAELARRGAAIASMFRECDRFTFRTAAVTDQLMITPGEWVSYTGQEPYDTCLPTGEIACSPIAVDGEIEFSGWVVGALPFGQKYGYVAEGDLRITLARSQILRLEGTNRNLRADLDRLFAAEPGAARVSEVGVGFSAAVTDYARKVRVGYQWHERHSGLHLGCGAALAETAQEQRVTQLHIDFVFAAGVIRDSSGKCLQFPFRTSVRANT